MTHDERIAIGLLAQGLEQLAAGNSGKAAECAASARYYLGLS